MTDDSRTNPFLIVDERMINVFYILSHSKMEYYKLIFHPKVTSPDKPANVKVIYFFVNNPACHEENPIYSSYTVINVQRVL